MKYDVHMYYVMRSKFCGIEADSHEAAIDKVHNFELDPDETEDADEVVGWLVDQVGDQDFENSISFEADGVTRVNIKTWWVSYDDSDGNNFDLMVRAYDKKDALALWREYYGEGLMDGEEDFAKVREMKIPTERGVVSW